MLLCTIFYLIPKITEPKTIILKWDLVYKIGLNIRYIRFNMPVVKIRKKIIDCEVCNIGKSRFNLPFPGDYDDCLLTSNFATDPSGYIDLGVPKIRNVLHPIRTFRVFNQRSQFFVFVNDNYKIKFPNLFKAYKACNGHFIQIYDPKYTITRRMVYIIRYAAYYSFINMNMRQIDRVITYDFGDTIFMEDPFGVLDRNSLYLSAENLILRDGWGPIILKTYDHIYHKKCDLKNNKMINGGTVGGNYKYVIQFLSVFLEYFNGVKALEDDQVYFNMIQYCAPINGLNVTILNNTNGFMQYCGHFETINDFPPNMSYPVTLFHFYNRPDCGGYIGLMTEKCTNFTKKITYIDQ